MADPEPINFRHVVIDPAPAGSENDILLIADVNGDGFSDIIVGGKFAPGPGRQPATGNLVWYEWPTWQRHTIGCGELEAGGVAWDLTGTGRPDIIAGEQWSGRHLFWWENPDDASQPWTRRIITDRFLKYHDQAIGDVDGDGESELVVLSQRARKMVYFDIPADPRIEPWPDANCHVIHDNVEVEGACVADVDGDGVCEIVAGANIFKPTGDPRQPWQRRVLIEEFGQARVALADLTGSGRLDIVLAEGESDPGRLVWLEGPDFKRVRMLRDDLFHPHSLAAGDFTGDGHIDIFCGEMNLGRNDSPRLLVLLNDGAGSFREVVIDCPQGTHEAKLAKFGRAGRPSIVGKPYLPHSQIDLWEIVSE